MPVGLRLSPASVDLDGFLAFIEAKGAVHATPCDGSAEICRFKIGKMTGYVAKRRDGRLTFAGIARAMFERMTEEDRAARIAASVGT